MMPSGSAASRRGTIFTRNMNQDIENNKGTSKLPGMGSTMMMPPSSAVRPRGTTSTCDTVQTIVMIKGL